MCKRSSSRDAYARYSSHSLLLYLLCILHTNLQILRVLQWSFFREKAAQLWVLRGRRLILLQVSMAFSARHWFTNVYCAFRLLGRKSLIVTSLVGSGVCQIILFIIARVTVTHNNSGNARGMAHYNVCL